MITFSKDAVGFVLSAFGTLPSSNSCFHYFRKDELIAEECFGKDWINHKILGIRVEDLPDTFEEFLIMAGIEAINKKAQMWFLGDNLFLKVPSINEEEL